MLFNVFNLKDNHLCFYDISDDLRVIIYFKDFLNAMEFIKEQVLSNDSYDFYDFGIILVPVSYYFISDLVSYNTGRYCFYYFKGV